MDFSRLNGVTNAVDPFLQTNSFSPSALSPVDPDDDPRISDDRHYGHRDVVLFAAGDGEPVLVSPSMVSQTIEPSQLADFFFSPSPSCSPTPFSQPSSPTLSATSYSSDTREETPPKSRRGRKPKSLTSPSPSSSSSSSSSPQQHHHDHHVHADEPYSSGDEARAKRHQTKLACLWCRKLSKKCDAQRPCGRCVQFNRCSECVDAPPRKPRAKGVDRGTYKKTTARDTATPEFQESAFIAKSKVRKTVKGGAGLSEKQMEKDYSDDDRIVNVKMEDVRMEEMAPLSLPLGDGVDVAAVAGTNQGTLAPVAPATLSSQGGSLPFTGPLEDLFTCSATPEMDDLVFSSPSPSPSSSFSSPPSSPSPSLIDEPSSSCHSSPETNTPLFFDNTPATSDLFVDSDLLVYQALNYYPSIMKILNEYTDAAQQSSFDSEEFQRLSDIALKA